MIAGILKQLHTEKRNCCLFEDPIRWRSDAEIMTDNFDYVYLGDKEVLYFFNKTNATNEEIDSAILTCQDYIFLCAMSSLDLSIQECFLPSTEITSDLLREFSENVSAFFIQAYDSEGYLMWVKDN